MTGRELPLSRTWAIHPPRARGREAWSHRQRMTLNHPPRARGREVTLPASSPRIPRLPQRPGKTNGHDRTSCFRNPSSGLRSLGALCRERLPGELSRETSSGSRMRGRSGDEAEDPNGGSRPAGAEKGQGLSSGKRSLARYCREHAVMDGATRLTCCP